MLRLASLLSRLLPDRRSDSVFTVDYAQLRAAGTRGLLFDLDNTVAPWGFTRIDEEVYEFMRGLQGRGFRLAFLSNHSGRGREYLRDKLGDMVIVFRAKKPLATGYRRALRQLGLRVDEVAMIGDQLMTDIWGAKRLGIRTILVEPVDFAAGTWWVRWRRALERWLLRFSC